MSNYDKELKYSEISLCVVSCKFRKNKQLKHICFNPVGNEFETNIVEVKIKKNVKTRKIINHLNHKLAVQKILNRSLNIIAIGKETIKFLKLINTSCKIVPAGAYFIKLIKEEYGDKISAREEAHTVAYEITNKTFFSPIFQSLIKSFHSSEHKIKSKQKNSIGRKFFIPENSSTEGTGSSLNVPYTI